MKRYYISQIVGDGSDNDPYRAAVGDNAGIRVVSVIPTGPDGRPTTAWALCLVGAKDHAALRADPRNDMLPDFPLDGKVSAINNATKNAMLTRLRARGIDESFVTNTDGYREVIRGLGRQLDSNFSEDKFDVQDVN